MTVQTKKINDLRKKYERSKKEFEKAQDRLVVQQELTINKENDLNKAKAEYISLLLTEYDVSLTELPDVLSQLKDNDVPDNVETFKDSEY